MIFQQGLVMPVSFLESIKLFCLYFVELSVLFVAVQMLITLIQQKYQNLFKNHLQKDSYSSYIKSILLGALTPFCSCSTIPLLRALLKANVAFGVCIAYLFTSPLINPIIVVMLFLAFGLKITLIYVITLCITIFIISILLQTLDITTLLKQDFRQDSIHTKPSIFTSNKPTKLTSFSTMKPQITSCCSETSSQNCCENTKNVSIKNLFYQSLKDYKKLITYIAIGMGIGACIHGFVPQEFIQNHLSNFGFLGVVFAAFIGILLYIRVEAIIPIGLALLGVGVHEGIIFSFLIAGAGCSLPELILLQSIFTMRFLAIFISLILLIAIGFGGIMYLI